VGEYSDPTPVLGPYFALYATTANGTKVKFSDRQIFDVGMEFQSTYTARKDGFIESNIIVRNSAGVTNPHPLFRLNISTMYMNICDPSINTIKNYNALGKIIYDNGGKNDDLRKPKILSPDPNSTFAVWTGNSAGTLGIFSVPRKAEVNGQPAVAPGHSEHYMTGRGACGDNWMVINYSSIGNATDTAPISVNTTLMNVLWYHAVPPGFDK
jgi:hypothetical protein